MSEKLYYINSMIFFLNKVILLDIYSLHGKLLKLKIKASHSNLIFLPFIKLKSTVLT